MDHPSRIGQCLPLLHDLHAAIIGSCHHGTVRHPFHAGRSSTDLFRSVSLYLHVRTGRLRAPLSQHVYQQVVR